MAIGPRIRKRVQAVRRAADGSAFEKCEQCGAMVAIALLDMHECGKKRSEVKKFRSIPSFIDNISKPIETFEDQPRSPFIFFVEDFIKTHGGNLADASKTCFNIWKNMPEEEQKPFKDRAAEVNSAYNSRLRDEAISLYKVDDEADSNDGKNYDHIQQLFPFEDFVDDSYDGFDYYLWEKNILLELANDTVCRGFK